MKSFKKLLFIIVFISFNFQFIYANEINIENKNIEMRLIEKNEEVIMKGPMSLPPSKEEVEFLVKRHEEVINKSFFLKIWEKISNFFGGIFS